ncbi:hypothetical protein DL96DRAFT_568 [Flagelloscypha sp. PMI_526]|nr:hypothetical protein DL96DRAFT_568 [Flagelloscypha sp. PMI_526]
MSLSFLCLPSEIHHLIVAHLLQLGGFDAVRISEVNKYFHDVARPHTLQNVKLVTLGRLVERDASASLLKQIQEKNRPVLNLFLDLGRLAGETYDYTALGNILVGTLHASSPTLETLFITIPRMPNIGHVLERSLTEEINWPNLRRLCIFGWHFASTPAEPEEAISQRSPRLTHIHLISPPVAHMVLQEGRCSRVWPHLTHLRLSNCTSGVLKLHLLGTALYNLIQRWKNETPSGELVEFGFVPNTTRSIFVQRPRTAAQSRVALPHPDIMDTLDELQGGHEGKLTGGRSVQVYAAEEYTTEDMARDWVACLAGGRGCWELPGESV